MVKSKNKQDEKHLNIKQHQLRAKKAIKSEKHLTHKPTKVASETSAPASIKIFRYPKKARNVYLRTGAPVRPRLVPAVANAQVLVVPALVHVDAGAAVGGEAEPGAAVAAVGAPQVGATLLADA